MAEREKVAGELAELESKAAAVVGGLETGELALEEKRVALLEEERLLSLAQEDLYRGKGEIQTAENRLEFQQKELLGLDRQKARLSDELANLQRQLRDASAELTSLEERRGLCIQELAGEEESLDAGEKRLEELGRAERELARRLEETRRELFAFVSELAQVNNQQVGAAKRLDVIAERLERDRREGVSLQEKLVELVSRSNSLKLTLESLAGQKREADRCSCCIRISRAGPQGEP